MSKDEMTSLEALKCLPQVMHTYNTPNFTKGSYTASRWFSAVERVLLAEIDRVQKMNNSVKDGWVSVKDKRPDNFVSVLGHMTDAEKFPSVRECYTVGNVFFFPALSDIHPVDMWREMPELPEEH